MSLTKKEIFDGLKEAKLNKLKAKSPLFRESPQPSPIREVPTDIPRQSLASPSDLAPRKTESLRDRFSSVKEQISKSVDLFTGGIREATKVPDKEDPRLLQSIKLGGSGAKRAYESTATGVLGNIASIPKFLRYTGIDAGRSFEEKAEAWRDELKQEDPRFIDDLLSGVGSMATFYIPSSGAMSAANMIAGVSPRLATAFGVGTMTILESGMEAGQSYDEAIKEGNDRPLAKAKADYVFTSNLLLLWITNKFGIFNNKVAGKINKAIISGGMEGVQEAGQSIFGDIAAGRPVDWKQVGRSGLIGTIIGIIMGGGTARGTKIPIQIQQELEDIMKEEKIDVRNVTPPPPIRTPQPLPPARLQLQAGESAPVIPPQPLNTQAEFQILAPNKAKKITTLQNKLEKIIALKEKLVSSDKATSKDVSAVKGLREIINGLESEISTARGQRVTATGPVRTRPLVVTVPPKPKAPVKTVTTKPTPKVTIPKAIIPKPKPKVLKKAPTSILFHGGFRGQLKVDKLGNINLGTSKTDIEKFGDVMTFDTSKMKVLEFPTKSDMFDAATNKQKYINKGIDVLISGNHAIAIRPQKFAKAVGKPFVKLGERTVAAEIKRTTPKKAIGRPATGITQKEALKRRSEKKKTGEVSIVDKLKAQTKELEKARVEVEKLLVKEAKRDLKETKRTSAGEVTTRKMTAEEKKKFGIDTTKTVVIEKFNPVAYKKMLWDMKNKYAIPARLSTFEKIYADEFKKESESDQALVDNKSDIILEFIEENFARKMTSEEKVAFDDGVLESTRRRRTSDFVDKYEGETQQIPTKDGDFILSKKAEEVLDFFKLRYGERGLTKRQLGVYKPLSDKVRVRSLSDISTVTHEVVHGLDKQHKIVASLVGLKSPVKAALKSVYLKTYPKAKITDPEIKQYTEGLSVFIENYFYDPAGMAEQYPVLIDNFIKPDGKFYNSDIILLLEKMNTIVDEYAQLTPDERIGAHIRRGEEIIKQQKGFNISQRLVFELFNRFEPLKRYAKKAGVFETWDDPTIQAFNWMNKNSLVAQWVQGNRTPILKRDGNFDFPSGTVKDYLEMVGLRDKEFDSYLVARRVVSDNNKLVALHNRQTKTQASIKALKKSEAPIKEIRAKEKALKEINEDMSEMLDIIESDDFRLQDSTATIEKYDNIFKAPAQLYDVINDRLLQFSYNSGLLTKEQFITWTQDEGYTSFRRFINDELASGNVGTMGVTPNTKVSSFKKRKGSALDIISPVYNQRAAISEVIGKGLENVLWNKVANLTLNDKEIASRFEELETVISVGRDGRITYPQERDPNTIPVLRNGKKRFYKAAPEFLAVAKSLRPMELGTLAKVIRIPSAIFTRLTTSANPFFAAGNLTIDQFSRLMQTKYKYSVLDTPSGLVDFVKQTDNVTQYLALGGKRQTLASYYELSPEAFNKALTSDKQTKVESVVDITESFLGLAEIPSNYSEIGTRLGEFKKALKAGRSHSEAMYDASQVTTPFQLTGNMTGPLGQIYLRSIPYLNAGFQVLYKTANTIKSNPKRVAAVYAGIITTATTLALAALIAASEKQKREFKKLQVHELSSGIFIPSPTGSGLIKIRIPQQIGALVGVAQLYIISKYDGNKAKMREYLESMTSFLPEQFDIMSPESVPTKLLPQLFKPAIEATLNKRTFPDVAPIVPPYMESLPTEEQYTAYTSRVSKMIGGLLGIAPSIIDFFVREQFGVIGSMALLDLPKFPLWRQEEEFKVAGRAVSRFYDNYNTLETQYKRVQNPDNTYSVEEKINITMLRNIYVNVNDLLGIQRDLFDKKISLSEDARQATFDLLVSLDEVTLSDYETDDKIQEIMNKLRDLQLDTRTIMLDVYPKEATRVNEEIIERNKKDIKK